MSEITVKGSCLCGSVHFEVRGEAKRFYHCHCQRCRKATGTGHASNILIAPQTGITWLKGEDLLSRYKVPEAERFYNCFCQKCGGPMPRVTPELDAVLIPAGSLDTEPPISPQGRIFYDSRARWSCSDDIPTYSEYPPACSLEHGVKTPFIPKKIPFIEICCFNLILDYYYIAINVSATPLSFLGGFDDTTSNAQ